MKSYRYSLNKDLVVAVTLLLVAIVANLQTVVAYLPTSGSTLSRHNNRILQGFHSKSSLFQSTSSASSNPEGIEMSESMIGISSPTNENSWGIVVPETDPESIDKQSVFSRIRKISNIASFLCVLDCTILPIITVALPLLGVINLGAAQLEFFHHLGHQVALFFVLPVGGLTTIINYLSHKKIPITLLATVGLLMIGLANSHIHHLPFGLGDAPHWLHAIQHGVTHRIVNILGCAFLLSSNYLSQQEGCAHDHGPGESCGHSHDHSHDHSCSHDHGENSCGHDHDHNHDHSE